MSEYKNEKIKGDYVIYKGKPLVRNGIQFRYGDMDDKYVLDLIVFSTKKVKVGENEEEIPDLVVCQITSTDMTKTAAERMAKQLPAVSGLYDALDLGIAWLDKMNKE